MQMELSATSINLTGGVSLGEQNVYTVSTTLPPLPVMDDTPNNQVGAANVTILLLPENELNLCSVLRLCQLDAINMHSS